MNNNLIDIKFLEWTLGMDPVSARISLYKHVRDIPYAIIAELRDPFTGPAGMLRMNKGSCVPKHFLLGEMLVKIGIPIKYASYIFNWDDKNIGYPRDLRELTRKMPQTAHLAVKALIDDKWVLLDATWDPPVKDGGFPVNQDWDGYSDTKNAVIPVKEIIHESLQERVDFSSRQRESYSETEKAAYTLFTAKLNDWLDSLRKKYN